MLAVCIRCGALKKKPMEKCSVCGFQPKSPEEKAKSLMLSLAYEIEGEYRGKSKEQLEEIGSRIRNGTPYVFDPREVAEVVAYAERVASIPRRVLLVDLIKWLALPLLILIAVFFLLSHSK